MKRVILGTMLLFLAVGTAAADTCKDRATAKNLAGAALTSFMKKCQADATKSCNTSANAKSLSGAAKTSFTKKCVQTAVGQ
jgi:psiF repeat